MYTLNIPFCIVSQKCLYWHTELSSVSFLVCEPLYNVIKAYVTFRHWIILWYFPVICVVPAELWHGPWSGPVNIDPFSVGIWHIFVQRFNSGLCLLSLITCMCTDLLFWGDCSKFKAVAQPFDVSWSFLAR